MSPGLFIATRGAYWQKHGGWLVKYRCKLERAHNEEPFNNAFDLNRNVMKIITSLARPGDAPINGRSTTIQPSLFTLCVPPSISRLDLPRSLSLSFSFPLPLLVSYLPRYRPLSLTSSRSDDEFIGGSRAEWSCNARLALFEGQTWKMKRSSVLATERLLAHVSAPIVAFLLVPSSSRCPLLATCLAWNLLKRERRGGYSINR